MKQRAKPLQIPDSPLYFEVELRGGRSIAFRKPRMGLAAKLKNLVDLERFTADATIESYAGQSDAIAALIGACWYDSTWELETVLGDDLEAYGQAVAEELHEAGLEFDDFVILFSSLLGQVLSVLTPSTQVEERSAAFFAIGGGSSMPA